MNNSIIFLAFACIRLAGLYWDTVGQRFIDRSAGSTTVCWFGKDSNRFGREFDGSYDISGISGQFTRVYYSLDRDN